MPPFAGREALGESQAIEHARMPDKLAIVTIFRVLVACAATNVVVSFGSTISSNLILLESLKLVVSFSSLFRVYLSLSATDAPMRHSGGL